MRSIAGYQKFFACLGMISAPFLFASRAKQRTKHLQKEPGLTFAQDQIKTVSTFKSVR